MYCSHGDGFDGNISDYVNKGSELNQKYDSTPANHFLTKDFNNNNFTHQTLEWILVWIWTYVLGWRWTEVTWGLAEIASRNEVCALNVMSLLLHRNSLSFFICIMIVTFPLETFLENSWSSQHLPSEEERNPLGLLSITALISALLRLGCLFCLHQPQFLLYHSCVTLPVFFPHCILELSYQRSLTANLTANISFPLALLSVAVTHFFILKHSSSGCLRYHSCTCGPGNSAEEGIKWM